VISPRASKRRNAKLTPEEEASLLTTAERLRKIGRERPFTEDEADTAVAIQRLLTETPLPIEPFLRELDGDLDSRNHTLREKRDTRTARRRKT